MSWDPNMYWNPYINSYNDPLTTNYEEGQSSHGGTHATNFQFECSYNASEFLDEEQQNPTQTRNNIAENTPASNRVLLPSVAAISSTYYHTYIW